MKRRDLLLVVCPTGSLDEEEDSQKLFGVKMEQNGVLQTQEQVSRESTQPYGNSTRPCACRIKAYKEDTRACRNSTRPCRNSNFQINIRLPDIHKLKSHTGVWKFHTAVWSPDF